MGSVPVLYAGEVFGIRHAEPNGQCRNARLRAVEVFEFTAEQARELAAAVLASATREKSP